MPWQLAACRETGDRSGEGTTLNNLGDSGRRAWGSLKQARSYYEQALVIRGRWATAVAKGRRSTTWVLWLESGTT